VATRKSAREAALARAAAEHQAVLEKLGQMYMEFVASPEGVRGGFIGFSDIAGTRRSDAYGALAFLARQTFVDPQGVAAVGFSQGGWVNLLVAEASSFELFNPDGQFEDP
jgi:dienelactone hydrolase